MSNSELTNGDFFERTEPFELFGEWLDDATRSEPNDPNAVALATVDRDGMPNVRMVLLKGFDGAGFVFYTNFESVKGQEILNSMKAAMCFHWKSLRRQVRIRGEVEVVSNQEADDYFRSRPRGSRIGAWASKQSRPLETRFALEKAVAEYTAKHLVGDVPRPALLVRLPNRARNDRVLARSPFPLARQGHLQARRRRLVQNTPFSVTRQGHPNFSRSRAFSFHSAWGCQISALADQERI